MDSLLSGQLAYYFVIAVLDAALLSWLGLRWFRRDVRTLMARRGGSAPGLAPAPATPVPGPPLPAEDDPAHRLAFAIFEVGAGAPPRARAVSAPGRRRLVLVYALAAAAHALVIAGMQVAAGSGAAPLSVFAHFWVNTWPVLPALMVLLVLDRRESMRLGAVYLVGGALAMALATVLVQGLRGAISAAPVTNVLWLLASLAWTAGAPLLLLLVTGWRRIRAVMPLALAATLLFGFGAAVSGALLMRAFDRSALRSAILDLSALTSSEVVYHGAFLLVSLPVGLVAWWLIRGVAAAFEGKAFSDVQLIADCWWLVVTAQEAVVLSSALGFGGVAGALAAFVAYRAVVALGLRRRTGPTAARLLLLRVFGYQARTERLFDRVAQRWRFRGPVQLIAGADLATRTAGPGDILRLLTRRTAEPYVASAAGVTERIAQLDGQPDPDGRYRLNQVYCHDDTWRPAVSALIDRSDRVLMDVRGFSERSQGCVFELEQLLWRRPSDATILVVDRTTDFPRLAGILDEGWQAARRAGRARGEGRIALVRVERAGIHEVRLLTACLLGAGAPRRVLALDEMLAPATRPATLAAEPTGPSG
jgi:hypothetical protein